jgi:hypothetical protein
MVIVQGKEFLTEEEKRLRKDRDRKEYWKRWGPYVAERQWATGMPCIIIFWLSVQMLTSNVQFEKTTREFWIGERINGPDC